MEAGPIYDDEVGQEMINTRRLRRHAPADRADDRAEQLPPPASRTRSSPAAGWRRSGESSGPSSRPRANQLPSGAFSIQFFQRPANSANLDEHLAATGHILEFLSFALPKEQLDEPWVQRAVAYLCRLLERTKHLDLECGALYHAAHGWCCTATKVYGPRDAAADGRHESSASTRRQLSGIRGRRSRPRPCVWLTTPLSPT